MYNLPKISLDSVTGAILVAKIMAKGQTFTINIFPALKVSLEMDGSDPNCV